MTVIICELQMGKAYQKALITTSSEQGIEVHSEDIPITSLPARLVVMADAYQANWIELRGISDYVEEIENEIKKLNSNLIVMKG